LGAAFKAFKDSAWGLFLIIVVMGGIYSGMFTPTEAAAMSAVYAFWVAVFVYKDMRLKDVPRVLLNSANMSAMLLYIITNAVLFSFIMTNENIPQALADWMLGNGLGMIAFLLAVNVILLLAGNFMEPSSIVLIFAPILFPVAVKLGHRPGAFRHHHGGEHGSRHVPSTGGSQPLCRIRYYQDGHHRADGRGLAVAAFDAGVPHRRDLLAGTVDLAAQASGHDVAGFVPIHPKRALRGAFFLGSTGTQKAVDLGSYEGLPKLLKSRLQFFLTLCLIGVLQHGHRKNLFHHQTRCRRQECDRQDLFAF
jgi:GNAT superfamily N-acetyltransferase